MFLEVERLLCLGHQLLADSKWDEALAVLKQAEGALPLSSADTSVCLLRGKVHASLSQAYERVGLLASAITASKMVHIEWLKSRALLLLRTNYPNEAAPLLNELSAIDKSWVDQVAVAEKGKKKVDTRKPSLLDIGPAAIDRLFLIIESRGLLRDRCISTKLFRTCRAMKDMAAKFIDFRINMERKKGVSYEGSLQCGSLTIEASYGSKPIPSLPVNLARLRHLHLHGIEFESNAAQVRIQGLISLTLRSCKNVGIDLTGVEELSVCSSSFVHVTGSLDSLKVLDISKVGDSHPLILHVKKEKPRLDKLQLSGLGLPGYMNLKRQLSTTPTLSIKRGWWVMEPLIQNAGLWKNVIDLWIEVDSMDEELWETWMQNLINCRGLGLDGGAYNNRRVEVPSIWPAKLLYLRLSGKHLWIGKAKTKRGPKGHLNQPKWLHIIGGDEIFGFKIDENLELLILEDYDRRRTGLLPKNVDNLQVTVIGREGFTPEARKFIPDRNVSYALIARLARYELFERSFKTNYYRRTPCRLSHHPPWGLSRRNWKGK